MTAKNACTTHPFSAEGILVPADWNESGEPIRIALSTYGEEIYIVDPDNEAGRALQELVHQKVRVAGRVYRLEDGRPALRVTRFELQQPAAGEKGKTDTIPFAPESPPSRHGFHEA